MKVVIVHYHLNPGGVTRIIESQVRALNRLSENINVKILCGNCSNTINHSGVVSEHNDLLNYNNNKNVEDDTLVIMDHIRKSLSEDAILHCHNPNLGKSPALTMAIYKLATEGYPIINHCHDFPEDRPANIALLRKAINGTSVPDLNEVLYPVYPRYHFVVLNSYDYGRLQKKGIPVSQIHLLPNPVVLDEFNSDRDLKKAKYEICKSLGLSLSKKICTYPVRGIERKNLGEFILLAALFADIAHFTITQPPKNPVEFPLYNRWKNFCSKCQIDIKFEAGNLVNHEELINISDFCITTSIREGFGMIFLEPWLVGTPVIGRDLPCITNDLKTYGVVFQDLYKSLMIRTNAGQVDFKDLSHRDQKKIIERVISEKVFRLVLMEDNPFLLNLLNDCPPEIIQGNQKIIKASFSIEKYGKELFRIYKEISR